MTGIVVCGAAGRMGRSLVQAVTAAGAVLAGALEQSGHVSLGEDAGVLAGGSPLGVRLSDDMVDLFAHADVIIDFSLPGPTMEHVAVARMLKRPMVIGTTGFDARQRERLREAGGDIPLLVSGNFSVGVSVAVDLLERAARAFGKTVDVEIVEVHHRHKVDAPSGTALMMAEAVATARSQDLAEVMVQGRSGHTGERPSGQIGVHALRGSDVVGDHQVWFMAEGERLEIRHVASSRMNFAHGAVRAALWLQGRAPGQYEMRDVLGLQD